MGEVHGADFPGEVVDHTERLVIIAFVEELDLVGVASSRYDHVLVFLAELAGVEEAGGVGDFEPVPVKCFVELAFSCVPLLKLVVLPPRGC